MSEVRDIDLWESGERKIEWVKRNMPLLNGIEKEFSENKPFKGLKVALSVHLEAKNAYLCKVLAAGGAEMYVTGSNPLSTQDDVAAALVHDGLNVFAWYNATDEEYHAHISKVIEAGPNIIIDDGGDLVNLSCVSSVLICADCSSIFCLLTSVAVVALLNFLIRLSDCEPCITLSV